MTQTPPENSGNRWEPVRSQRQDAGATASEPPAGQLPASTDPYVDATAVSGAAAPGGSVEPRRPGRTRPWLAGGAASVLLVGGLGGFALGRVDADDSERVDRQGVPAGFDRDGDGDGLGGGPGAGPGERIAPPEGQVPDRDDDDSDDDDSGEDDDSDEDDDESDGSDT